MADEQMMGAEADDVQFMRTVKKFILIILSINIILGRSYMLKLCSCFDDQTNGIIR
jgi:hypothetical protein